MAGVFVFDSPRSGRYDAPTLVAPAAPVSWRGEPSPSREPGTVSSDSAEVGSRTGPCMEPEGNINNKEILDVRKVIERSTSKVSLRDLEKKGFRKVKVLRAGDINQLIYKAVQTVLAKQPAVGMGEAERQQVLAEAKAEYERQTKQIAELQEVSERVEGEREQITQAKQNLEKRLAEVNAQLVSERNKILEARKVFEEEKRQLERE